ncbi:conserved hypothetical protein [Pseudomonas sp. OF001]|uniref:hypothetical protein n=1 Tax=unclassified Pseudomonas TaxID=196821 RepID=UPI0010A5D1C5|nr:MULTISPECIES: hypothetical protein [unclassified Pseudomonas]THG81482.1 hypothetical protein E5198_12050 [Pseudomonas sp. A-1]CAD5378983.1 conserved hypothetical protein [Pseudomonas sp. OF001]
MQVIRNAWARLIGDTVSREEHEAAQERIRALLELSANQQAEIMDQAQRLTSCAAIAEAYKQDLQQSSAEVVRLRAALARVKGERAEWRDRALGYREKMGMQRRRGRG